MHILGRLRPYHPLRCFRTRRLLRNNFLYSSHSRRHLPLVRRVLYKLCRFESMEVSHALSVAESLVLYSWLGLVLDQRLFIVQGCIETFVHRPSFHIELFLQHLNLL